MISATIAARDAAVIDDTIAVEFSALFKTPRALQIDGFAGFLQIASCQGGSSGATTLEGGSSNSERHPPDKSAVRTYFPDQRKNGAKP